MLKSIRYVLKENFTNLFRIYSIAKYELLSDMRDSKLGVFWNFANPAIQIITYYFVFGIVAKRNRRQRASDGHRGTRMVMSRHAVRHSICEDKGFV